MATATADKRFTGNHDIVSWAVDLIAAINRQGHMTIQATPTNVGALITWANHESGGYNPNSAGGRNNPLNTTQKGPGWIGGGGSQGNISDFADYQSGVQNQATNLLNPRFGYPRILAALQQGNNAPGLFAAVDASSFGTHFGTSTKPTPIGNVPPPGQSSPVAGGGTPATLTGFPGSGIIGDALGGLESAIPGLSQAIGAGKFTAALAGTLLGVFQNWRYVLELFAGVTMILIGVVLIAVDTGAAKNAGKAAAAGAVVAAA